MPKLLAHVRVSSKQEAQRLYTSWRMRDDVGLLSRGYVPQHGPDAWEVYAYEREEVRHA